MGNSSLIKNEEYAGNIVLPETEKRFFLTTTIGMAETIAETYEGSSDLEREAKSYSLFVFGVDKMDLVQKGKTRRFGESYRFFATSPMKIKDEVVEKCAMEKDIILKFREPLSGIYGVALKSIDLLDIREVLGILERKYS
ncbi:MAG: hypothetical protein Q7S27_01585 [Nanoarchaeota archaeon]|nr:hypothetical protein [Nanoarchaeota archaeon]